MLTNTRGAAVLAGTVTKATFSGLPIIGCCDDYTAGSVAQSLLDFADALGVPAIVTDVTHDGDDSTPALAAALKAYSKWFVPGLPGKPYLEPDGVTASPLCGPLLTLSSPLYVSSPSKADMVARTLRNLRRNHKLGLGAAALYVPRGNDPDSSPLPPVYLDHFIAYDSAGGQTVYYSGADTATPYTSLPYYQILRSCWQSGNWTLSGDQSLWPSLPATPQVSMKLGIDALRGAGLPVRHFFASLAPLLLLPEYRGGGTFDFYMPKTAGSVTPGTWTDGDSLGINTVGVFDDAKRIPWLVQADGYIENLVVQGNADIAGATVIRVFKSRDHTTHSPSLPLYEGTALNASWASGAFAEDTANSVEVLRGDMLILVITGDWACDGCSINMSFRPKGRTIFGVEI